MHFILISFVILICSTPCALAAPNKATSGEFPDLPARNLVFRRVKPRFNAKRRKRSQDRTGMAGKNRRVAHPGLDGAIQFLYGTVQPSIVCAVNK